MKTWTFLGAFGLVVLAAGCTDPTVDSPPVSEARAAGQAPVRAEAPAPATRPSKANGKITEVDLNRLLQLQDSGKAYLIDVRPTLFYTMGHIPGAVSIPKKSFPLSLVKHEQAVEAAVKAGKVLVLYCQNVECPDGYAVGKELAEMGYSTSLYKGGWEEWKQMGF